MVLSTLVYIVGAVGVKAAFDCDVLWANSLKPENFGLSSAATREAMEADGWEVKVWTVDDPEGAPDVKTPQPVSRFTQIKDTNARHKPGFSASGAFRSSYRHYFDRPYQAVQLVVENSWLQQTTGNVIDLRFTSEQNMRGAGTQLGQESFNRVGTLVFNNVAAGDFVEIEEFRALIGFVSLKYDCADLAITPDVEELPTLDERPELPPVTIPQPEGPVVTITTVFGCENPERPDVEAFPVVWAQGECQADPQVPGMTMKLECVKDTSLWVQLWENGSCDGLADQNLFLMHGEKANDSNGNNPNPPPDCLTFLLAETIRKDCGQTLAPEPTPAPAKTPVHCHTTGDPHFKIFEYFYQANGNTVARTHQQRYFDFQSMGEFDVWNTDGLDVQVRHGSRLDMVTTTVSTNNALVVAGDKTCGVKFEIYGDNGYWMRAWPTATAATPVHFYGKANVLAGLTNFAGFHNCASMQVHTSAADDRVQWTFGGIVLKAQLSVYGIDIWLTVPGADYLETDTGICPGAAGWERELDCNALFTYYPNDDCPLLPRTPLPPIDVDACDETLRAEAEQRCGACPDVVLPEECVREVCGAGNIAAAAQLLKVCDIEDTPIVPRPNVSCQCTGDPHCVWFDGVRQDFQSRGEYLFYKSKGVTVMTRHGYRPDIKHADHVSTNHGVAIKGPWTCGNTYEFFHDDTLGLADPHTSPVSLMRFTRDGHAPREFRGLTAILAELADSRHSCAQIVNRGNVIEFVLNNDAARVRVQQEWWGINVWVDVRGPFNSPRDTGMCSRNDFSPVSCDDTIFTLFPENSCPSIQVVDNGPPVTVTTPAGCAQALIDEATQVCDVCPGLVTVEECVFEACTIGDISAAHEMVKACQGTPVAPVPEPAPEPLPEVYCSSYNDPHFDYFDGSAGDNMNRGHFLFYETDVMRVETRHGPYLTLSPTNPSYDTLSTNNAFAMTGSYICGAILEVDAAVGVNNRKIGEARMRITKNGVTTRFDSLQAIRAAKNDIDGLLCGGFGLDNTYADGALGPIFYIQKNGYNFRWQNRPFGVNVWIRVEGQLYLSSDAGMCTKRGDYTRALDCNELMWTEFPEGHTCEEEKANDREIPAPVDPDCDPDLRAEATRICNECPDVVAPQDCVVETCLLGAIEFATAQMAACGLAAPAPNSCGRIGKIRKRGKRVGMGQKKTKSPCECEQLCRAAGGLEWERKSKKGQCRCYAGSKQVVYRDGDIANPRKRIVGRFNGSPATEQLEA